MSEDQSKLPVEPVKVEARPPVSSTPPVSEEVFLDRMDFEHWLVAGKRKGTGKSSLAIALVFWLKTHVKMFKDFKIVSPIPVYDEGPDGYAEGYDREKPNGYPYTNYHGTKLHKDYIPLNDFREALYVEDCILLLDDAGLIARARDWSSGVNKFFTKVAKNARHHRVFIIYTAQRANELDIDLRFNVERIFVPKFREKINILDALHGSKMEEARKNVIEWDEYIPKNAQERFYFEWEADSQKKSNLMRNVENPLDPVWGKEFRPTWERIQTYFDTNKEPSYSHDQTITRAFRDRWGAELRAFLMESPDSLIKRKFLNRREFEVPLPAIEHDVDFWSSTTDTPLSDQDKQVLIHDFEIQLDENRPEFEKAVCPHCGWSFAKRRTDRGVRQCGKCHKRWYPENEIIKSPQSAEDIRKRQVEHALDFAKKNGGIKVVKADDGEESDATR